MTVACLTLSQNLLSNYIIFDVILKKENKKFEVLPYVVGWTEPGNVKHHYFEKKYFHSIVLNLTICYKSHFLLCTFCKQNKNKKQKNNNT